MTIKFSCSGCGEGFTVPDVMAGTQASCDKCGASFTVPRPNAAPQPAAPQPANPLVDTQYQAPPSTADAASADAAWNYGTLGGVACVLALTVLIVLFSGSPRQRVLAGGPNVGNNTGSETNNTGDANGNTNGGSTNGGNASSDTGSSNGGGAATQGSSNPSSNDSAGSGRSGSDNASSNNASNNNLANSNPANSNPTNSGATPANSGSNTAPNAAADDTPGIAGGPAIPDIIKQEAIKNGIPREVIEQAFGGQEETEVVQQQDTDDPGAVGAWNAAPDPPIEPVVYKAGRINAVIPDGSEITYPRAESNFVLVHLSSFGKHAAQMVDLRTGDFVGGTVTDELPFASDLEVSADGNHLAVERRGANTTFGVWSMQTGQLLNDFQFTREQDVEAVHFGAANQIIFVNEPFSTEPLKVFVYSVGDGGELGEYTFPMTREAPLLKNTFTVSHAGKYAVFVQADVLTIVDLSNGQVAGRTRLPEKPKECVGMAFSPDGAELAGLFNFNSGSHMVIWDMRTGNPIVDAEYDEQLSAFFTSSKKPVLTWAPDKSAILLGREFIMDAQTGKKIWQLPEASKHPVKFVRPFELLIVNRDSAKRKQTISTVKLPRKEIDKIVTEVRSGGSQIDAALPPLASADLFSAVPKSHPSSLPSWSYQADPLPANPRLKMDKTTLLATTGTELERVKVAGLSGKAVTLRNASGKLWLEKFDLLRAKRSNQTQLPTIYDLLDTNSDGGRALIGVKAQRIVQNGVFNTTEKGFDRLDVVATEGKKHIAGWRPYGGEAELDDQILQWARFVDDDHVATVNSKGKLILWQLPDCKAVYLFKDFGRPLAASPSGRYVLSTSNDSLRLYDLSNGDCVGELESPPNGVKAVRAAFRQDGQELAAVIDGGRDHTLARWSLSSGGLEHNFPLHPATISAVRTSSTATELGYRGDDHLLIDQRYLVNLPKRAVIWRYNLNVGRHIADSPDGRHWYCAPYQSSSGPWHITAITMPGATVKAASEFNKLESQLALYPGVKLAVNVQLNAAAGSLSSQQVLQGMTNKLTANGYVIDQQNPQVLLTLTTSQGSTGEQVTVNNSFSPFNRSTSGGGSFSQEQVTCTMTLTNQQRQELWKTSRNVAMRTIGMVRGDNAQSQLRAEMLRSVEGLLKDGNIVDVTMPRYVFKDIVKALSGESDMTLAGEGQRVSPEERKKAAEEAARRARQNRPSTNPGMSPGGIPGRPGGFPGRPGGFPGRPGGFPSRPGGFPGIPSRGGSPF